MALRDYFRLFDNVPVKRSAEGPIAVIPVEAKNGPWTGNQNLGSSRVWTIASLNRQTIFKMPEWGMPRVWTVSLGLRTQGEVAAGNQCEFTAELVFGSGGTTQQVDLDWVTGSSISVPANTLEVVARQMSPLSLAVPGNPPPTIELSVMVAHGAIGTPTATRTVYTPNLDAFGGGNTSTIMRIPPFAKWFTPFSVYLAAAGYTDAFSANMVYQQTADSNANVLCSTITGAQLYNCGSIVPVVGLAKYLRIDNITPAAPNTGFWGGIVFGLAY